jgi:hypothetical protein
MFQVIIRKLIEMKILKMKQIKKVNASMFN